MTAYFTIREFNEITNYGEKVKNSRDFEFVARARFHKIIDPLNLLFRLSHKNKLFKRHWIAKNVQEIYKYHRLGRLLRTPHE